MTNRKIMVTESSYQGETLRLVSASQKQQEEKGKHCWSAKVERQIVTWKPTPHETQKGKQYVLIKPKPSLDYWETFTVPCLSWSQFWWRCYGKIHNPN